MADSVATKKRGRPTKTTSVAETNNSAAKDSKKKKTPIEKKESKIEEDVVPAKRGRGRPKGSIKPAKPVRSGNKRGRGRPKKAEAAASESSAEENDNDTDE